MRSRWRWLLAVSLQLPFVVVKGQCDPWPPDPVPMACASSDATKRFALALYGGVSLKDQKLRDSSLYESEDVPGDVFVNLTAVASHFAKHVIAASGGQVDVFIHSNVPSIDMQTQILQLFRPTAVAFDGSYARFWGPAYRRRGGSSKKAAELSRWSSAVAALNLVNRAETMAQAPYDLIYLSRVDVLLWRDVDLRRYCRDAVYASSCRPEIHPKSKHDHGATCPSDFHYVMTSSVAAAFRSNIINHVQSSSWHSYNNEQVHRFFNETAGVPLKWDHIAIGRHEELLRKDPDLLLEAQYRSCLSSSSL